MYCASVYLFSNFSVPTQIFMRDATLGLLTAIMKPWHHDTDSPTNTPGLAMPRAVLLSTRTDVFFQGGSCLVRSRVFGFSLDGQLCSHGGHRKFLAAEQSNQKRISISETKRSKACYQLHQFMIGLLILSQWLVNGRLGIIPR